MVRDASFLKDDDMRLVLAREASEELDFLPRVSRIQPSNVPIEDFKGANVRERRKKFGIDGGKGGRIFVIKVFHFFDLLLVVLLLGEEGL